MKSNAGIYVGLILIAVLLFFCFPPLLYLMAILFGVVIPIQAGSLILSVRAIFKMDADFKSAYLLMSIVLFVTAVIFFIVGMMSANIIIAFFPSLLVGALILGNMMKDEGEPIGLAKGCLVSILTTVITIGIWLIAGTALGGMFG